MQKINQILLIVMLFINVVIGYYLYSYYVNNKVLNMRKINNSTYLKEIKKLDRQIIELEEEVCRKDSIIQENNKKLELLKIKEDEAKIKITNNRDNVIKLLQVFNGTDSLPLEQKFKQLR